MSDIEAGNQNNQGYSVTRLEEVFRNGPHFAVTRHRVITPTDERDYFLIVRNDSVGVVPYDGTYFYFLNQWRPTTDRWIKEPAAGTKNDGESSLQAAVREQLEESGFMVSGLQKIGDFYTNVAIETQKSEIFLARGLNRQVANPEITESIDPNILKMTLEDIKMYIREGVDRSGYTLAVMSFLLVMDFNDEQS